MTVHLRSEWNARPPKSGGAALVDEQNVALHHIGGGVAWPTNVASVVKGIQLYEMSKGYRDIAYNWGVDYRGDEWELRGDTADGATLGYSGASVSILVICNGAVPGFTVPAVVVDGIVRCIKRLQRNHIVGSNPRITIEDHRWFDAHITSSPTWCASDGVRGQVAAIQSRVLFQDPVPTPAPIPAPQKQVENMHFYDKVNPPKRPNRSRSIDVLPSGLIFRSNGGRIGPHDYTDPTLTDFGEVKFYDIPSTFGAGETFVGANYHPDGSNRILYQSRLGSTGELADRVFSFTADGA